MTNIDLWTIEQVIENLNQADNNAIPRALYWMKNKASSVLLYWGECDNLWECSWTIGGKRYVGSSENMTAAIVGCLLKVKHRNEHESKPYYVTDAYGNRLRHG
jgi:hypothetical protein